MKVFLYSWRPFSFSCWLIEEAAKHRRRTKTEEKAKVCFGGKNLFISLPY